MFQQEFGMHVYLRLWCKKGVRRHLFDVAKGNFLMRRNVV
jgi:hypothetical protein